MLPGCRRITFAITLKAQQAPGKEHSCQHNWREALQKSSRTACNMTVMELEEYFEQIELLDNLKQKKKFLNTNVMEP
eukprot:11989239-Ditylum_brightwellii.AAC.1